MLAVPRRTLLGAAAGLTLIGTAARAQPRIGGAAPDFTATDSNGQAVSLAALRGRLVVLEWTNDGCPYVGKWYGAGAMQALQRDAAGLGAVWLSIISSAPGEQGYADGAQANALTRSRDAAPTHVLLDPRGDIGHRYDAKTTPEMFIIAKDGTLQYMGGADSIASTRMEDLARAQPYARQALTAVAAGQKVPQAVTRPYGCTIKYAA